MRDARRPWTLANAALIAAAILVAVAGLLQAEEAHAAQEARANVLLVASDPGQVSTTRLADYLSDAFDVEITTIGPDEYAPLIDVEAFDGFVYLGNDYYKPPGAGFLADMAATDKSVLWVNYHAWLLPQALQDELGMSFGDVHSLNYTKADFFGMRSLTPTDTSLVEVEFPARTLFWLYSDDLSLSLPGSAASGRFVHVSYLPALLVDQPAQNIEVDVHRMCHQPCSAQALFGSIQPTCLQIKKSRPVIGLIPMPVSYQKSLHQYGRIQ